MISEIFLLDVTRIIFQSVLASLFFSCQCRLCRSTRRFFVVGRFRMQAQLECDCLALIITGDESAICDTHCGLRTISTMHDHGPYGHSDGTCWGPIRVKGNKIIFSTALLSVFTRQSCQLDSYHILNLLPQ